MKRISPTLNPALGGEENFRETLEIIGVEDLLRERYKALLDEYGELYVINRVMDKVAYLDVFKNAFFEYQDGHVLLERFYKKSGTKDKSVEMERFTKRYLELEEELVTCAFEASKEDDFNEDLNNRMTEIRDEIKSMSREEKYEVTPVVIRVRENPFGVIPTYLMMDMKEIDDDYIEMQAASSALLLSSFAISVLGMLDGNYTVEIKGIDFPEHVDLVANILENTEKK